MNLLSTAARVLNIGGAREPTARDRLRAKLESRAGVERDLAEAAQAVERVEDVIDAARAARNRAMKAHEEATTASIAWAASGADPASTHHEHLARVAAAAELEADRARDLADAATKGLGAVQAKESECAGALTDAVREIREAAGMIPIDEVIATKLAALEHLAREYEVLQLDVLAFHRVISPARPGWRDSAEHEAREAAAIVAAGLARARIREPSEHQVRNGGHVGATDPELLARTGWWRSTLLRLRENPDAEL
jgi:hypothetical protein